VSITSHLSQIYRGSSFDRVLRHRNFVLLETIGWFSIAGVWFYRVGIGWLTWEMTHSGAWLGFISLAEAAPAILLSPVAGAYADRFDRLAMGRVIQMIMVVQTAILAALTILDLVNIWILLAFSLTHGIIGAFWAPVRHSIVANVVPREDITPAVAIHSMLFNVARFLGPALAVPIIALWGIGYAFAVNAVGYFGYLVVLYMITLQYPDERNERRASIFGDVKEGLLYSFNHPALKYLFVISIVASIFLRAYSELLAGIADSMFGQTAEGFATLVSVTGIGAIGGAIWISCLTSSKRVYRAFNVAVAIGLVFLTIFAATKIFWVGVATATVLGFSITAMNISAQVLFQTSVKGVMRGRVMSFWTIIARAGPAIGAVIVGEAATWLGFQIPLLGTVLLTAAVGAYVYTKRRIIEDGLDRDIAHEGVAVPTAEATPATANPTEKPV
jgi:predicted MFS family arabinose efflux permease